MQVGSANDERIREWMHFVHDNFVGVSLDRIDEGGDMYSDDESGKDGEQSAERQNAIRMFLAIVVHITKSMGGTDESAMRYNTVDPERLTYEVRLFDYTEANRQSVWRMVPGRYYKGHSTEDVELPTRDHIRYVTAVVVVLDARAIFNDVILKMKATPRFVAGAFIMMVGVLLNLIVWAKLYHYI